MTGPSPKTILAVRERSQLRCEACASARAAHVHHRKLRRFGDHTLINLLHVCLECHNTIHANPTDSYDRGLLVHSFVEDPADILVVPYYMDVPSDAA
jgi:hypothetical protein